MLRLDLLVVPERGVLGGGFDRQRRAVSARKAGAERAAERGQLLLDLEPLARERVRLPFVWRISLEIARLEPVGRFRALKPKMAVTQWRTVKP